MSEAIHKPGNDAESGHDRAQTLRMLGARAHQLRATTRAADHYNAQDKSDDKDTGAWLMSTALALAYELAADLDTLARSLKDSPDPALNSSVPALRTHAHQLHAATKAADHFLEQDGGDDHDTGSWLVATATALATKLAAAIDDAASTQRRPVALERARIDKSQIEPHDAAFARRVAAATGR